jgi:hypothetical protein
MWLLSKEEEEERSVTLTIIWSVNWNDPVLTNRPVGNIVYMPQPQPHESGGYNYNNKIMCVIHMK